MKACLRGLSWMVSDVLNLLWPATIRQELAAVHDDVLWYRSRCEHLAGLITAEELARVEEQCEVLGPGDVAGAGVVDGLPSSPPAPHNSFRQ